MRKYCWIIIVTLIGCMVSFASCQRIQKILDPTLPAAEPEVVESEPPKTVETPVEPPEMVETPAEPVVEPEIPEMETLPTGPADVLIYTGSTWWMTVADATIEAETTRSLLQAAGIQVEITESEEFVREWMLQTTANGSVNVLVSYGVIPNAIYPTGNTQPDGSIAENWIETSDGDAILNQSDWLGYSSTSLEGKRLHGSLAHGTNAAGALENLMDIPNISLFGGGPMVVTADGSALTPSLVDFNSDRPFPLDKLEGDWFAEKIFASDTGDTSAAKADPVVLRDGDRGRLVIVEQVGENFTDKPKGEVVAEIIINFLL